LENRDSVDQKTRAARRRALDLVARYEQLLRTQGAVVASYRLYRGRRLGPFFRVAFRVDGRQRSIYLGKDPALAEEVRGVLARLQAPLERRRGLKRQRDAAKAGLRRAKIRLEQELARVGLGLKGYEVRGWRTTVGHHGGQGR
jgi:hypothetical protein